MHAADLALNRWPGLLAHFGIDRDSLTGKHTACPVCGGRDRFRFDDKDGRGTFYCSHCGAGDGFKLLQLATGKSFKECALDVEAVVGVVPSTTPSTRQTDEQKREACRRIWRESSPVTAGDPVALYLARRCPVDPIPGAIRFHSALPYRHDDRSITRHPAMVCRVQDAEGKGCAIHRTYLTDDGMKAAVLTAKKLTGRAPTGAAVRLSSAAEHIGVAEGIETALAASLLFGVPVWSAISACGLERWTPPPEVKRVIVFGDNDASGTGQAAAWSLAKRMIAGGIRVDVKIPCKPGTDWNDAFLEGLPMASRLLPTAR